MKVTGSNTTGLSSNAGGDAWTSSLSLMFPSVVKVTPGSVWSVDSSTKAYTTGNLFLSSSVVNGTTCSYINILKEIHYVAYVTPGTNIISSVIADAVYFSYTG